jgi:hypothetical protein
VAKAQGRSLVACIKQQKYSAARFTAGRFSLSLDDLCAGKLENL